MRPLEMWAGIECTLNRAADLYFDQCEKNGHYQRLSDLALFHGLGIKKLRYPCLWERVAPYDLNRCDWSSLDERLNELKRLGQPFIAGLLHHGSGPRYTSLIDPELPEKFSTYARLFATRYPWVEEYTPINEINTTARFSCLYGHWYPHLKSDIYYLKSLIYQCKATIMAMREIRRINPGARFIQTEDIGRCQSTEQLAYQSNFENERRWLSFDLLEGKLTASHSLFEYMINSGISRDELKWFEDNPLRPDVIGINSYHLSNRFLDHRLDLYPAHLHGGNGIDQYADVGAIDTGQASIIHPKDIILDTWERYQIPLAITECHTRGEREQQMRWLNLFWETCIDLRQSGVEIEAVTAWSLLGTYDWQDLCTSDNYFYEPGVFDLRNPDKTPQPTGLSNLVADLAKNGHSQIPALSSAGTWHTSRRLLWGINHGVYTELSHPENSRPIVITGAAGTLGRALATICGTRNIHYISLDRKALDITITDSISNAIKKYKPWAIINAAGYVRVDDAETDQEKCHNENVKGAINLAKACFQQGIKLINFSSDLVFDGFAGRPYCESDEVSPLNYYGQSKVECEESVLSIYPESLVIRTSSFFGPWDNQNFLTKTISVLHRQGEVEIPDDIFISPTYVPDLAHETLTLLVDNISGIIHLTNIGEVSWKQFAAITARFSAKDLYLNPDLIIGIKTGGLNLPARRPKNSVLRSERHSRLPRLEDAIQRYLKEIQVPLIGQ